MKSLIVIGLLLFFSVVSLHGQTPYYYYYGDEKQYLELDTKHIFVSVSDANAAQEALALENASCQLFREDIEGWPSRFDHQRFWTTLTIEDRLSDEAYLEKMSELKSRGNDILVSPWFKNRHQEVFGMSNFFNVMLKSLNDTVLLSQLAEKEHAVIVYPSDELMPFWFVLSVTERSQYNAMEIANRFYETGLFHYAYPDLMIPIHTATACANDPHFANGNQWGLNGVYGINICPAWEQSTGQGVTVAVIDHGIQLNHPDLAANMHQKSFDSETSTENPSTPPYGSHGTQVAGVIGALRNNKDTNGNYVGIAGVAPNCTLMSISNSLNPAVYPNSELKRARGIRWAWLNGAAVINCSWYAKDYQPAITNAIDSAVNHGRGGLGCVVVSSTGNENISTVSFPANLSNVIGVGAIDNTGNRWVNPSTGEGSNYDNNMDVVAPGSAIWSTTSGSSYNFGSGTSFAAPHVAGIAALILSVRPDLKYNEVRDVIKNNVNRQLPNKTWLNSVQGLVDAYESVNSAFITIVGDGWRWFDWR